MPDSGRSVRWPIWLDPPPSQATVPAVALTGPDDALLAYCRRPPLTVTTLAVPRLEPASTKSPAETLVAPVYVMLATMKTTPAPGESIPPEPEPPPFMLMVLRRPTLTLPVPPPHSTPPHI